MNEQNPPSPAHSLPEDYGLQYIIEQNSVTPYPASSGYVDSEASSRYGSPAIDGWEYRPHQNQRLQETHTYHGSNLEVDNEWYRALDTQYMATPYQAPRAPYRRLLSSPLTPASTDTEGGNQGHMNVSRPIARSVPRIRKGTDSKPRSSSSPKPTKAAARRKGDRLKVPRITAPLSELTKGMTHIPLKDMEAWVTRSAEVRQAEVEKRKGYVTRPMNSFMLYRSAYAERTKIWCLQNNHQVVSSVSGESWPLEPAGIRDLYNEYAKIERGNHQKAHPGYKFSPSKTQSSARKRKSRATDDEGESSELGDPEQQLKGLKDGAASRTKSNKRILYKSQHGNSIGLPHQLYPEWPQEELPGNTSSYPFAYLNRPYLAEPHEVQGQPQYYEGEVQHDMTNPIAEEMRVGRALGTVPYEAEGTHPIVGLPEADRLDLFNDGVLGDPRLDPMLLRYDDSYLGQLSSSITAEQFRQYDQDMLLNATLFQQYPEANGYNEGSSAWQHGEHGPTEYQPNHPQW